MTMTRPPLTAVPLGMPGFPARVRPVPGAPASGEAAGGPVLRMGLDIGSTTVKLVVLPESSPGAPVPEPLYSEYRRARPRGGGGTRSTGARARARPEPTRAARRA